MMHPPGPEQADGIPRGRDEALVVFIHEFRSSLAAIWNAVHLLTYARDEATIGQVRQMVTRQVERLTQMVDGIEAGRLSGGGPPPADGLKA
jgi:hypothetical protein